MCYKYLFILAIFLINHVVIKGQVTSFTLDPEKIEQKLASQLDSLFREDQESRIKFDKLLKVQASTKQIDSLKNLILLKDSANLVFANDLIEKHGWLGPDEVGLQGAQALFLIIQHANLKTQKKYYPLILEAEKKGKILSSNVAILEDRIAVREGRPQTYGSQGYYDKDQKKTFIYPIKDLDNLDSLRSMRGLSKMIDYKKDWNIQDYKSYLKQAEEKLKKEQRLF